jgi:hypothetical protein
MCALVHDMVSACCLVLAIPVGLPLRAHCHLLPQLERLEMWDALPGMDDLVALPPSLLHLSIDRCGGAGRQAGSRLSCIHSRLAARPAVAWLLRRWCPIQHSTHTVAHHPASPPTPDTELTIWRCRNLQGGRGGPRCGGLVRAACQLCAAPKAAHPHAGDPQHDHDGIR